MEILEIKNSSAISKVSFNNDANTVGVAFTYNTDKEYLYHCDMIDEVKDQIFKIENAGGSVGKLINAFRKDGTFEQIEV